MSDAPVQEQRRDSLASTPNPTAPADQVTTESASKSEIPPSSSVGQNNAPGALGEAGEKIMGAFGVGGTTVERPKQDQGLGEKIVNLLGA